MTNVVRANRTIEDRARFGVGSDTQDDQTAPATDEIDLGAEGVLEAGAISDPEIAAAEVVNASYRPVFTVLTADGADVNNSTAMVDAGLAVTLGVGTYHVKLQAVYTTAAAADLKIAFAAGTATITAGSSYTYDMTSNVRLTNYNDVVTWLGGAKADSTDPYTVLEAYIVTTVGGTLKIQIAQNTQDVSNSHLDTGSYLKAERVA